MLYTIITHDLEGKVFYLRRLTIGFNWQVFVQPECCYVIDDEVRDMIVEDCEELGIQCAVRSPQFCSWYTEGE